MNDLEHPDITRAIRYGAPLGFEDMQDPPEPEDESEAGCDDIGPAEHDGSAFGHLLANHKAKMIYHHARRA